MECNRDEAFRAKAVAEQRFIAKDVTGAKKFALKAQNIFPALEGISQMIATLDIYLSAELKINGERDWYAVLSVNPSADEETVKRQYRRLALQLHPDKNKSIGAEGAFKLISEAWSVLSDKSRKMVYDQKRNVRRAPQKKRENFGNNAPSNIRTQKSTAGVAKPAAPPSSNPLKPHTFWTSCDRCRMQYEYLRVYLNHNLLCPNCHEPFFAIEKGIPVNLPKSSVPSSAPQQQRQNSNHNSTMNFHWAAGAAGAAASSSAAAQAERARKEREEALRRKNHASKRKLSACGSPVVGMTGYAPNPKTDGSAKKISIADENRGGTDFRGNESMASEYNVPSADQCFNSNMVPEMRRFNDKGTARQNNLSRESSLMGFRNALMEKAKVAIHKKLEAWDSAAAAKLAEKEEEKHKQKHIDQEKAVATDKLDADDQNKSDAAKNNQKHIPVEKDIFENSYDLDKKATIQPVSIDVPDPDFHDFDLDRSEGSFEGDQIWATYDSEDGMPRFYALVQKVISLKPFKIRMSFLSSKSNVELGPLNWVASGFSKTCGDFRVGRYEVNDTVNIFSHPVKWEKGARGFIRIFPRKGDTWALYRNWSSTWNEHTPDDVIHKYDMVEVVDDYSEERGVAVTPLVKVAGFKTVFHRHLDPKEVKWVPKEEMFRFSHQVPSHLLTGEEAHNAPRGCRELDPAATPLELLQVITEIEEDESMETAEQLLEAR